ncbi:putative immunoglobulin-like domain containing protein [Namao virus]|nr:putative immunoglobulin-like domain containing protein [Namao virus]
MTIMLLKILLAFTYIYVSDGVEYDSEYRVKVKAYEGDTVRLDCRYGYGDKDKGWVIWVANNSYIINRSVLAPNDPASKYSLEFPENKKSIVLVVPNVTLQDSGKYDCDINFYYFLQPKHYSLAVYKKSPLIHLYCPVTIILFIFGLVSVSILLLWSIHTKYSSVLHRWKYVRFGLFDSQPDLQDLLV